MDTTTQLDDETLTLESVMDLTDLQRGDVLIVKSYVRGPEHTTIEVVPEDAVRALADTILGTAVERIA